MDRRESGMSALKFLLVILVLGGLGVAGFVAYRQYADTRTPVPTASGLPGAATVKIGREEIIAKLDKQVRAIPASRIEENLRGYRQLLAMAPDNARYRQKVAYYEDLVRQKVEKSAESPPAKPVNQYVKISDPAPRVLSRPDNGNMMGRADPGAVVKVLEIETVYHANVPIEWYRIPFRKSTGWISQLGTFGGIFEGPEDAGQTAVNPISDQYRQVAGELIDAYKGKVTRVTRLTDTECWVQLTPTLSFEEARQTSEHIGYFLQNSTGHSPEVTVFVGDMRVAVAKAYSKRYAGKLYEE